MSEHGFSKKRDALECPLCFENAGDKKNAILNHLSSHHEEISLMALPTILADPDCNSRADSVSSPSITPDPIGKEPENGAVSTQDFASANLDAFAGFGVPSASYLPQAFADFMGPEPTHSTFTFESDDFDTIFESPITYPSMNTVSVFEGAYTPEETELVQNSSTSSNHDDGIIYEESVTSSWTPNRNYGPSRS